MAPASCYLFRDIPDDKIGFLEAISQVKSAAAGQWLFHKDDFAEKIYLVEKGAIELLMPVDPDIEIPVALIRPGNGCLGVGALLEPYLYSLSARCKEDSLLTIITSAALLSLFRTDPEFGHIVMTNLAQRLLERLRETREEVKIHFMNLIQSATFS
jgi:CRP-like cAMP-binding protein